MIKDYLKNSDLQNNYYRNKYYILYLLLFEVYYKCTFKTIKCI